MKPEQTPHDPFTTSLGLIWDELTAESVTAHLDVTPSHHQPMGIVHGGVHTAVIEVAASMGAWMNAEDGTYFVGVTNKTDFVRSHRSGRLQIHASPVFVDRETQVWDVEITRASDLALVAKGTVRLAGFPAALVPDPELVG